MIRQLPARLILPVYTLSKKIVDVNRHEITAIDRPKTESTGQITDTYTLTFQLDTNAIPRKASATPISSETTG